MRYVIIVFVFVMGVRAFSLKEINSKITLLKESKNYDFKEIKVPYDPFYKAEKLVLKKEKNIIIRKKIKLRLITVLNNKAFINHRWYKKDDIVYGMKIIKIYPDYIVLKNKNKKVVVNIVQNKKILNIVEKHK